MVLAAFEDGKPLSSGKHVYFLGAVAYFPPPSRMPKKRKKKKKKK